MNAISDPFSHFARTADAVGSTTKRLEKLAMLAEYFSSLSDDDLAIACRFLSGHPFPSSDERTLNVGYSAVSNVLLDLSGADPRRYGELVLRLGDPGDAAEQVLPTTPVEPSDPITLRSALDAFEAIASTRGPGRKPYCSAFCWRGLRLLRGSISSSWSWVSFAWGCVSRWWRRRWLAWPECA